MTKAIALQLYRQYQMSGNLDYLQQIPMKQWNVLSNHTCVNCGYLRGEHIRGCCENKQSVFSTGSNKDRACEIKFALLKRNYFYRE